MKKEKVKTDNNDNITMTIKQEKLLNRILELEDENKYLRMVNESDMLMLNFVKGQIDVYEKILNTKEYNDDSNEVCN